MKPISYLLLAALLAARPAWAQWPTSPEERLVVGYGVESRIVSDGEGGAFVIFPNYPGSTWNHCYLQKLSPEGYPLLSPPIGLEVGFGNLTYAIEAVTDGEGGVIIAVTQLNTANFYMRLGMFRFSHDCDTIYYNVFPDTATFTSFAPRCVPDSAGGVYLLYGHNSDSLYMDCQFSVQRLGPSGERLWGDMGYTLPITQAETPNKLGLGADRQNCFALLYTDTLVAMKFTLEGAPLWGDSGTVIPYLGESPFISPDGTGGLIGNVRGYISPDYHLLAFRLDNGANWMWNPSGLDLGVMSWGRALYCRYPYAYMAWDSTSGNGTPPLPTKVKLCLLDYQGNPILPENITVFSGASWQALSRLRDADGTGLLFCGHQSVNSQSLFFAQKYDYTGQRLWDEDVMIRSENLGWEMISSNDFGGALFSWCEVDPLYGQLICSAMVNTWGELGGLGVSSPEPPRALPQEKIHIYPNPVNAQSRLALPNNWMLSVPIIIKAFNLQGKLVLEHFISQPTQTISLDFLKQTPTLSSQIYILQVRGGSQSLSTKFLYVK